MRIQSLGLCLAATLAAVAPSYAQESAPRLRWTPDTIEWGFIDGAAKPVLRIKSGDTVVIDSPLAGAEEMRSMGMPESLITPQMREIDVKIKERVGGNILVGPIYVEGAEPGDVLEVHILKITPADNYAVNVFHPNHGALQSEFPYFRTRKVPLDLARNVALAGPGIEIPLRPFFGTMAVAPAAPMGRINDEPPGYYAGNMDNKELVAGTTLYLPIQCKGALFSVGDGHVGQGDGEVDGTAIEAALTGEFQFKVRKDMHLLWPRAELPNAVMTMGFDRDLNIAAEMAVREMVQYLESEHHLNRDDAYMLTSMAVDLHVTQVVDGVKGVHALLPKGIFKP
jgi:acetamidase/formamidase